MNKITSSTTTVTTKGQVTIPYGIRSDLGIKVGSKIRFIKEGKAIKMYPVADIRDLAGSLYNPKAKYFSDKALKELRKSGAVFTAKI